MSEEMKLLLFSIAISVWIGYMIGWIRGYDFCKKQWREANGKAEEARRRLG